MVRRLTQKEIVVATHNEGKVREINDLIAPFGLVAKSAKEHGLGEPVEDGTTFEENAAIKALAAAKATNLPALADDSGLAVDALDGAPGIHTADWAETPNGRDFAMAMRNVEEKLQAKGAVDPETRGAQFVCVLCLAWPDGHKEFFRGEAHGMLIWPPQGEKGFGYDPVFMPEGHEVTFGEMTAEEKHGWKMGDDDPLSHRARAFKLFAENCLTAEG